MNAMPQLRITDINSRLRHWTRRSSAAVLVAALGTVLFHSAVQAYPQTRQGFYFGLGLGTGSADLGSGTANSTRLSGSAGSFRFGFTLNPNIALGLESNSWLKSAPDGLFGTTTLTLAASVFPAEGLVLRAGVGAGAEGGAGDGLGGEAGSGLMVGAAYEFRVARSFALGPQVDYNRVKLNFVDRSFVNVGLLMTWYFIPQ